MSFWLHFCKVPCSLILRPSYLHDIVTVPLATELGNACRCRITAAEAGLLVRFERHFYMRRRASLC